MDAMYLEMQLKRILRYALTALARFFILSSFLADALHLYTDWSLERSILGHRWPFGLKCAGLYISCIIGADVVSCLMMLVNYKRHIAAGVLSLLVHLRLAINPAFWSMEMLWNVCALNSSIMVALLRPSRRRIFIFLLITYCTCSKHMEHALWNTLYRYAVESLMASLVVGCHPNLSAGLLSLLIAPDCWHEYAWWEVPITRGTLDSRDLKRFQFWKTVSVLGGIFMVSIHSRQLQPI